MSEVPLYWKSCRWKSCQQGADHALLEVVDWWPDCLVLVGRRSRRTLLSEQGYLAHKKHPPPYCPHRGTSLIRNTHTPRAFVGL
jgi:hypothetical protein